MADNFETGSGSGGPTFAAASISFSGDTVYAVGGFGVILSGSADSYTGNLIVGGAGAVGAGVQRMTLASDDPAVVDLAAIEVLLTGMDVDTDAIKTAVQLIGNAISGSEMQVDVVAALPAGTNLLGKVSIDQVTANANEVVTKTGSVAAVTNAGTFVVQENGAALTALQLLDNAVYVDDADWTDNTSSHLLVGELYQRTRQTITDGDIGRHG